MLDYNIVLLLLLLLLLVLLLYAEIQSLRWHTIKPKQKRTTFPRSIWNWCAFFGHEYSKTKNVIPPFSDFLEKETSVQGLFGGCRRRRRMEYSYRLSISDRKQRKKERGEKRHSIAKNRVRPNNAQTWNKYFVSFVPNSTTSEVIVSTFVFMVLRTYILSDKLLLDIESSARETFLHPHIHEICVCFFFQLLLLILRYSGTNMRYPIHYIRSCQQKKCGVAVWTAQGTSYQMAFFSPFFLLPSFITNQFRCIWQPA